MKKKFYRAISIATFLACTNFPVAAAKEPLRIGVIDPLSGPMASVGIQGLSTIQFEAERLNKESSGIHGHSIEIVSFDNKVNPQESLIQLQKGIDDGIRIFAQGQGSAVSSALVNAIDKYNRRNPDNPVLFLNFGGVDPVLTNEKCSFWHFRFDNHANMKMKILTDWIAENKTFNKIFLINQDYSFGHDIAEQSQAMLKEKRPDIEFVGNIFHPIAKVKDFTPYITQIKSSGADAVITGNWGADITLLVKAASASGLDIPFLTYYANSAGTYTQLGKDGVDRTFLIWGWHGDFENPTIAERQVQMYKDKNFDYGDIRATNLMEMLKIAAEKANSINPKDIAFALEDLSWESPTGNAFMRADDHQIHIPLFISIFKDNMPYGAEGTEYHFKSMKKYDAKQTEMPTTCKMNRPQQS